MKKNTEDKTLLTKTELELMNLLWDLGEGSVRDVMAALPEDRELAYTSVSTILRILEKKDFLKSRKESKTHIYTPLVAKESYEVKETGSLLSNLFSGSGLSLVKCLIDNDQLSEDEMESLKKMIEEKL
ncbi:MAG: BlaI/MecI/CopY family transcriptional regulator [Bdellovibrionota bacterium]|nr:BlaI/MecI/CopY family transcriptional regulator [Bdellovibrionota bacterium]